MPVNYKIIKGDSPKSIAIKFYGDGSKGALIIQANPGLNYIAEPVTTEQKLIIGQDVIIPDLVDPIPALDVSEKKIVSLFNVNPEVVGSDDQDEVVLMINGQSFRGFNNLDIKFDYDKIANEFSFDAPFEPDIIEYRNAFKPIYQPTSIYIGGELVITGMSSARPNLSATSNTVKVTGYSITGTLDRTSLTGPFEYAEGVTFSELITDVAARMGIVVVIDSLARNIASKPYEKRIEFSPSENIGGKITSLARERGLILSPTFNGRLLVTKPKTEGETVQAFVSGELPALRFRPTYNPDALHTSYIAYAPGTPDEDTTADTFTLNGISQPGILPRIKGITPADSDNINLEDVVRAERGRAYAEWLKASLIVAGWRDKNGNIYQPNTLVTVKAPRSMIYEDTMFFIRAVTLSKSEDRKSARLDMILPEAYSGRDLNIVI